MPSNGSKPAGGAATGKLYPYTFTDTGLTVHIRKVSPNTIDDHMRAWQRQHAEPNPPVNMVDMGNGPEPQPNEADPAYQRALVEHQRAQSGAMQRLLIRRGVVVDVAAPEVAAAVAEFRQDWQEANGEPHPGTDKEIYINHICVGTGDDLTELIEAITARAQPTAKEVAAAEKSFPG